MSVVKRFTWYCEDCHSYFKTWEDEDAVCPSCANRELQTKAAGAPSDLAAPAIRSPMTGMTDRAADMAMESAGVTNMRDGVREGETHAAPMTHSQIKMRDMGGGFWKGLAPGVAGSMIPDGHTGIPKGQAMEKMQKYVRALEGN